MVNIGCFLAFYYSFLAPVLVAAHTTQNLDLDSDKRFEDAGYESD